MTETSSRRSWVVIAKPVFASSAGTIKDPRPVRQLVPNGGWLERRPTSSKSGSRRTTVSPAFRAPSSFRSTARALATKTTTTTITSPPKSTRGSSTRAVNRSSSPVTTTRLGVHQRQARDRPGRRAQRGRGGNRHRRSRQRARFGQGKGLPSTCFRTSATRLTRISAPIRR